MPIKKALQPTFINTIFFVIMTAFSFSASAGHHGDTEHKAKKMMDKTHATDKASMKSEVASEGEEATQEAKEKMEPQVDAEKIEIEVEIDEQPGIGDSDG